MNARSIDGYISYSTLLGYKLTDGTKWTKARINFYLGEPDEYAENPHNPYWAPRKLYLEYRVEKIEKLLRNPHKYGKIETYEEYKKRTKKPTNLNSKY